MYALWLTLTVLQVYTITISYKYRKMYILASEKLLLALSFHVS
jgi:hypothetical protein